MATVKADALRQLPPVELEQKLASLTDELFRLRFKRGTEPLENPLRIRTLRREIARVRTVLRERRSA